MSTLKASVIIAIAWICACFMLTGVMSLIGIFIDLTVLECVRYGFCAGIIFLIGAIVASNLETKEDR